MTDYHQLIARAVEGLDSSTGEVRRALYERARNALVAQLRSNQISEADINKQRLALEKAIRKVEAEAARKSRSEPRSDPRATAPPANPPPTDVPQTAVLPSARDLLLSARSSLRKQGKAAQTARHAREAYEAEAPQYPPAQEPAAPSQRFEPHLDAEDVNSLDYDTRQERNFGPDYETEDEHSLLAQAVRYSPRSAAPEEEYERNRPPLARLPVVLIILAVVVATISWQWPAVTGFYQFLSHIGSKPQTQVSETPSAQPNFSERFPQEQDAGQAPGTVVPGGQTPPAVAQRAVLFEEDPNDQQGRRYIGSAIWRTETVSQRPGLTPELAVRANVEIAERRMTVTWSLRRNIDKAMPASHTIEFTFNLPADFPGGGIANVPGILMKQDEQARGTPLAGLAVKVTNGFFLIGLSADDTDVQRNVQLLKDRSWFDIPIVYTNGSRAILAMEKGPAGDRAFGEAFAAWEKK
jgi:hypothetical protein